MRMKRLEKFRCIRRKNTRRFLLLFVFMPVVSILLGYIVTNVFLADLFVQNSR